MKKTSVIVWILKRVHRRIPEIVVLTAARAGSAVFSVFLAVGMRGVIDTATSGMALEFYAACLRQALIVAGILICLTVSRLLSDHLQAQLDRDWKGDLLHHILSGEYAAVSAYHSGELINRLNNDVRVVDDGILSTFPGVAAMLARLICAMIVLYSMEPWFALVILAAGIAVVIVTGLMRRMLKNLHKSVSEQDGKVSSFLQEALEKLLMVQAMDVSAEMERRADRTMERRYQVQRRRRRVSLFANTSVSILSYGASFASLVWCAAKLLAGQMSFGSLTAVTQLVGQLQVPFTNMSAVIPQYAAMCASGERLMELMLIPEQQGSSALAPEDVIDGVGAEKLAFSYDRDTVLHCGEFFVPTGFFAAITGLSGVGKSTLLKLLLGIYSPEAGTLYVRSGEKRIALNRGTRRLFAYVPQGNLLLSGTLRENLLLANPGASEEQVQQAVYVSGMDEFLPQLPQGMETVLGESGAGLSEGQAQRLAIARAILTGAPILLLDESTSALDGETERLVLQRIRGLKNRTCLAVTHRPAALELCDLQIEIRDGTIITTILNETREVT